MSAFVRLGFDNDRCGLHRAAHPDRNAPIPFEFEPVRTAEDARNALTAVIGAMAASEITGAEAACLACRRADHAVSRITQRR